MPPASDYVSFFYSTVIVYHRPRNFDYVIVNMNKLLILTFPVIHSRAFCFISFLLEFEWRIGSSTCTLKLHAAPPVRSSVSSRCGSAYPLLPFCALPRFGNTQSIITAIHFQQSHKETWRD